MSRPYRPFDPFDRGGPFEGAREIRFTRPPRRFWFGVALFGLAIIVFLFASPIVWFFTEREWYNSLGYQDVFTTRWLLAAALFIGSFTIAFVYLAANAIIALRIRSGAALRAVGIRRTILRSPTGAVTLVAVVLVALILSGGAGSQWQN